MRGPLARSSGRVALAVLGVLALVAAACGGSTTSSTGTTAAPSSGTQSSSAGSSSGQIGLTSNSVTVANVSVLSGPVPGLFQGAPYGAEAYAAYVNSKGGIDGRKLEVKALDDAFSCSTNEAETRSASSEAFAFVGSFSLFDNCGAKVLAQNPSIPDVSFSLDPVAKALPNNYSPQPAPPGSGLGPYTYLKQHYPSAVKSVGALVGNVASALSSWDYQRAAMQSIGYHISYFRAVNPLETSFTSDIVRMRNAGVQFLFLSDEDAATTARVVNAATQQQWHPQLVVSATAYSTAFIKQASGAAAQLVVAPLPTALYLGQDRDTTPAVSTFLTWMHNTHPNFSPDIFSVYGWTSAELFAQALAAAGPSPTRDSVLSALRNIHSFNADGMLPTADVGSKKPPTCWLMAKVHDGSFVRVTPPNSGFTCNPGGYYYAKGR